MSTINEYMQNEMDQIVVKTLVHIQKMHDKKGQEQADQLINMIADGIKKELSQSDMSDEDITLIGNKFVAEIYLALSKNKH